MVWRGNVLIFKDVSNNVRLYKEDNMWFNICLRRVLGLLGVRNGVTMRSGAINGGIPSARFLCLLQIPLPFPLPIHVPSEWLVIIWLCQLQTALRCISYSVKMCHSKSIFHDLETYLQSKWSLLFCIISKKLPYKKCNFSHGKKKVFPIQYTIHNMYKLW